MTLARSFAAFLKGMASETLPYFVCFFCGGLVTAANFRLDFGDALPQLLVDTGIVFLWAVIGCTAYCAGKVAKSLWRNRGFVKIRFTRRQEGRIIIRAVLDIPREWLRLSMNEQARLVEAQLNGQGPF